jgi:hypothetical protein
VIDLPSRGRPIVIIWAVITAVFVAGVAGAATIDEHTTPTRISTASAAAPAATAPSMTAPAPASPTTAAPGRANAIAPGATKAAPSGTAAKAAGSGANPSASAGATSAPAASLGPAADPGPAAAPRPGTYKERHTTTSGSSTTTEDLTTKIENESQAGSTTNQKVTISSDKGSFTSEVAWKPDSVLMLSNTFGSGASTFVCNWTPPVQLLALPLSIGTAWSSDSRCTVSASGQTETVHETMQAKVTGLERISVAGKVLDCWVISRTTHVDGTGAFNFTSDSTSTEWFSPKYGQSAKSTDDSKNSFTYNGSSHTNESKSTTEALTLDPG